MVARGWLKRIESGKPRSGGAAVVRRRPEAVRHTSMSGEDAPRRLALQVQDIAHILALERPAIMHGVVQKRRLRLP